MLTIVLFSILSLPIIWVSRKCLWQPGCHGFYRFWAWECIAWLLVSNLLFWFIDFLSWYQVVSWILLFASAYFAVAGILLLKKTGNKDNSRSEGHLHGFEKTSNLVETGLYRYIRHPLYSSLLLLSWGIFFKHPSLVLLPVTLLATAFLITTARIEEKENLAYFGEAYKVYMKRSRMFIPYIF